MRRLVAFAVATLALAACQQTVHLYASLPDGGGSAGAKGQSSGGQSGGGGGHADGGAVFRPDGGGADTRCPGAGTPLPFSADQPQIAIVLDRSTNMNQSFANGESQYQAAVDTLYMYIGWYSPSSHSPSHPSITFSLVEFPGQDAGCSAQTGCCVPEATRIFTPPDFTNAAYDCPPGSGNGCVSSDHRPLSAALAKADQALPQSNNPRFIVLVTDGAPQGNCALPDDCIGAQNELTTLQNHGIRPVVILRLGDGTGDCLLNLVSGTGSQQYYTASSYGDLVAALGTILSATVCHVTLTPAPPVQDASRFQVSINTHLYSNDEKTGWTYDSGGRLHLHGQACDDYAQSGRLQITTACPGGGR